ncbi:VCBS repeat-containing protein [Bremerella cremea]|uniref:VCBS repeat-containing protein n=1 Tax=Bremerella cremea TaxID=1031537 RepID=A0A368KPC8_9BACT|nr:VCBS repeat-containing protein [Bremerella cremea]RCS42142.1 VCBS repeat-containing protein [Bremerella cremea]
MKMALLAKSVLLILTASLAQAADGWKAHKIADNLHDHQRIVARDINRDGLVDVATIATDPNQASLVQVYLHPGKAVAKRPWLANLVGEMTAPRDLVIADLDGDNQLDIVTSHQSDTEQLMFHRAVPAKWGDSRSIHWVSEVIVREQPELAGARLAVGRMDTLRGEDIICAGTGAKASLGWLQRRGIASGAYYLEGYQAIAQIEPDSPIFAQDLNRDGLTDLLFVQTGLVSPGIHGLINPGPESASRPEAWRHTRIGGESDSINTLAFGDIDHDKLPDLAAATASGFVRLMVQDRQQPLHWKISVIPPAYDAKQGTSVAIGDFSGNGYSDVIQGGWHRHGEATLVCYRQKVQGENPIWVLQPIAVLPQGTFETVLPYDLDRDGDLDLLTLQLVDGVGKLVWYENPS